MYDFKSEKYRFSACRGLSLSFPLFVNNTEIYASSTVIFYKIKKTFENVFLKTNLDFCIYV